MISFSLPLPLYYSLSIILGLLLFPYWALAVHLVKPIFLLKFDATEHVELGSGYFVCIYYSFSPIYSHLDWALLGPLIFNLSFYLFVFFDDCNYNGINFQLLCSTFFYLICLCRSVLAFFLLLTIIL